jgi:hypothetical protein
MRETISPQFGRMRVMEDIKQEGLDAGSFLLRTEEGNFIIEVKINGFALKLDKVNAYGDPEPHMDVAMNVRVAPKVKGEDDARAPKHP